MFFGALHIHICTHYVHMPICYACVCVFGDTCCGQFLTLKGGNERMQLIPVLTTMLKFSPEEKEQLVQMASGQCYCANPLK